MIHPTSGKGRLGARVRVRTLDSVADELQSLAGTITRRLGHPDHAAHGVLLDGGDSSQLLWQYQLRDKTPRGRQGNAGRPMFTEALIRGDLTSSTPTRPNEA
jgi:hypothetical protein